MLHRAGPPGGSSAAASPDRQAQPHHDLGARLVGPRSDVAESRTRCSQAPGTKHSPFFIQQPRPEGGKISGLGRKVAILEIKVKPVIKLPDAGVLPDLSCSGPGTVRGCFGSASALPQGRWQRCPAYGQLSSRSRSPRREFKCQRCRKPAGGGSPRVLARTARPAGPCKEKLSRAQPCLWAGAPLETRGRCLGREGC